MDWNTLYSGGTGEYEEKKSRFIATIEPVSSEEEAVAFVAAMKKKYWDARHNCSAYVILDDSREEPEKERSFKVIEKANDDGEPSKTAGSPILEAIKGAELKNTAIVVTRYFGGVLLGTGGLVRAYGGAAQLGIEASHKVKMELLNKIRVVTDYNSFGRLKNIAENTGAKVEETEFTSEVSSVCLCDDAGFGVIQARMNEATAGKCKIELLDRNFYPWE